MKIEHYGWVYSRVVDASAKHGRITNCNSNIIRMFPYPLINCCKYFYDAECKDIFNMII